MCVRRGRGLRGRGGCGERGTRRGGRRMVGIRAGGRGRQGSWRGRTDSRRGCGGRARWCGVGIDGGVRSGAGGWRGRVGVGWPGARGAEAVPAGSRGGLVLFWAASVVIRRGVLEEVGDVHGGGEGKEIFELDVTSHDRGSDYVNARSISTLPLLHRS